VIFNTLKNAMATPARPAEPLHRRAIAVARLWESDPLWLLASLNQMTALQMLCRAEEA
jgi:hypothetical protein